MNPSITRWAWLVGVAALSACGGGSQSDASAISSNAPAAIVNIPAELAGDVPAEASEPPLAESPVLHDDDLERRSSSASVPPIDPTALMTSTFEEAFTSRAPGWTVNFWGSPSPRFATTRETGAANVHTGAAAQRFRVTERASGADAHLIYPFGFVNGKSYRLTMNIKASAATTVVVQLRRDAPPWQAFAARTVALGTDWQRVVLEGTYAWNSGGSIRVIALDTQTDIYVDDVTLHEVQLRTDSRIIDGGIDLPAAGGNAVTYLPLVASGAEGSYTSTAPGWRINYWGSPSPRWVTAREARPEHVRSGAASQLFRPTSVGDGDVHLTYPYAFAKGKKYRATLYMKSDMPATVEVMLRRDAHPWDPFGTRLVTLGANWQKVEVTGTYLGNVGGTLRIAPKTLGANIWIDDMSIEEVVHNELAPVSTEPIPARLFGMHVNKFGHHQNWPGLGNGMVRLWNTGTTWRELEPVNNAWNFDSPHWRRLDMLVDYVKRNDPSAEIIYTMGQTPQWASKTPTVNGLYGMGASGAPANMADWRDYVRTVARRYAGRIRYWELWNEPDYAPHYNGTIQEMVEMARIAREEIKAADPLNELISPGVTSGQGMPWLSNYLAAGGAQVSDIIGFHWYFNTSPERVGPAIANVRQLMENHGIGHKELWNTEGAPGCDSLIYTCSTFVPTAEQRRSVTVRALMMMWTKGVSNQNYYFWERTEPIARLVEADFRTPTEAAHAYREGMAWMKGARLIDAYQLHEKVYVFRLNRGSENQIMLWSTEPDTLVNLPSLWNVTTTRSLLGFEAPIPGTRQLRIGIEPVLLKK